MRAQAELQFDGDFDDVCDPTSKSGIMYRDALGKSSFSQSPNVGCIDPGQRYQGSAMLTPGPAAQTVGGIHWAASVLLSNSTWFCVDSSGAAKESVSMPIRPWGFSDERTC
jgi:hypothetical protein